MTRYSTRFSSKANPITSAITAIRKAERDLAFEANPTRLGGMQCVSKNARSVGYVRGRAMIQALLVPVLPESSRQCTA